MDAQSSEFMSYNMKIQSDKIETLQNIKHYGDTCLVQTVSPLNSDFYNLLTAYNKQTNLPFLANTSFNLPGLPFVETLVDAFETIIKSNIQYMYIPEIKKFVYKV